MGVLKEDYQVMTCTSSYLKRVGGSEHAPFPEDLLDILSDHSGFRIVCRYSTMPLVYIDVNNSDLQKLISYIRDEYSGDVLLKPASSLQMIGG